MLLDNTSGQWKPVTIIRMQPRDINQLRDGWTPGFNWKIYFRYSRVEVYKMTVVGSSKIEGAIALELKQDHVWIHLIEKAPSNRGVNEKYSYVAHHLFAFAAMRSFERADGFVAFEAKTGLIKHYIDTYGAVSIGGSSRMILPDVAGKQLIDVYLK